MTSSTHYSVAVPPLTGTSAPETAPRISCPAHVADLVGQEMAGHEQEHLRVLLLDSKSGLRRSFDLYIGTVDGTTVRIAEILREAVRDNAPRLIIAHNHPSGDPIPSPQDVRVTRDLVEAGQLLDIEVLDHVIIGGTPEHPRHLSLREHRLGFSA